MNKLLFVLVLLFLPYGLLDEDSITKFCFYDLENGNRNPVIPIVWYCLKAKCYLHVTNLASWGESRRFCKENYHGDLASIHNEVDNEIVLQTIVNNQCHIWIGARRHKDKKKTFYWVDNSPWDFNSWEPGEPNNFYGDEDCVEGNHLGMTGGWNDKKCYRKHMSVCEVHITEKILLFGGFNPVYSLMNSVETFIPQQTFLNSLNSEVMLDRATDSAVGVIDDLVFIAGGTTEYLSATDLLQMYNSTSFTFYYRPPMNELRTNAAATVINNKFCVCGGTGPNGWPVHRSCECYNHSNHRWSYIASMTVSRTEFAMATVNEVIYAVSGWPHDATYSAEKYNLIENKWSQIAPMRKGVWDFAMVAYNDHLVACGGYDNVNAQTKCEIYNPGTDAWSDMRPMNTGRAYFEMVLNENQLVALGGWNDDDGFLKSVEIFENENWIFSDSSLLFSRYRFSAVSINAK